MRMRGVLQQLAERRNLAANEAEEAMNEIIRGEVKPGQIAAFMVGLKMKGETYLEIAGCARAMRSSAIKVKPRKKELVDTCGTGGDGSGTFNISTAAAFAVAAAGMGVAKHGNRSVSSRCGSADVLEALGLDLSLTPSQVADCIDKVGIGFLFAPALHPAMGHAIGPRRDLGIRTIFNILGPLTNPAEAQYQVVGVYHQPLTDLIARTLNEIGVKGALVVHGYDGLDEITLTGPSHISVLKDGMVTSFDTTPEEMGLQRCDAQQLKGGSPADNAEIIRRILSGEESGPRRDVVLANAGAALLSGGRASSLLEGVNVAREVIDSGAAYRKLTDIINFSFRASQSSRTDTGLNGGVA